LFYHDYWYRPYEGHWYRAKSYNGPWVYVVPARVPHVLLHLHPDFRRIPSGHERIPYGHLKLRRTGEGGNRKNTGINTWGKNGVKRKRKGKIKKAGTIN
jgi:hypothetical protein